jgi:TctA family transporter
VVNIIDLYETYVRLLALLINLEPADYMQVLLLALISVVCAAANSILDIIVKIT